MHSLTVIRGEIVSSNGIVVIVSEHDHVITCISSDIIIHDDNYGDVIHTTMAYKRLTTSTRTNLIKF
jgi:hypothetical protein